MGVIVIEGIGNRAIDARGLFRVLKHCLHQLANPQHKFDMDCELLVKCGRYEFAYLKRELYKLELYKLSIRV